MADRVELDATGERSRKRTTHTLDQLTPREAYENFCLCPTEESTILCSVEVRRSGGCG